MAYYVQIHYGPYESFFTLAHKPQKLTGVRDRLRKLGYRVDLKPVQYYNYCVFEMMGHEVFRCNIQNLQFNTEANLDPVSLRAIDACLLASLKLERARNHFFFWSLLEDSVLRTKYAPKDHWPVEIKIKRYGNCLECVQCCGEGNMDAKAKIEKRLHRDNEMLDWHKIGYFDGLHGEGWKHSLTKTLYCRQRTEAHCLKSLQTLV